MGVGVPSRPGPRRWGRPVCPHKNLSGFHTSDIDIQLRKRGIDMIVLCGMSANLCVESHLRDAEEKGYEVLVVNDATAAAGEDAYKAALTNFDSLVKSLCRSN